MTYAVVGARHDVTVAVVREKGARFQIERASIDPPGPDDVIVPVRDQDYPVPLPVVLGHEGSGIVEAVGSAVVGVEPGDHVVMTWPSCGKCRFCIQGHPTSCEKVFELSFGCARPDGSNAILDQDGHTLHGHFFGQSSFSSFAVASERNVVKVTKEVPIELLGPLGCGIQTGAGAVFNALKVWPRARLAVFGAGAVGLSAVMAARVAGASMIIAVDVAPKRLELALELGATHVINSRESDPVATIQELAPGGAEFSIESSGRPAVLRQAVDALGKRGTCGVVGAPPIGSEVSFDINHIMVGERSILGITEGNCVPHSFRSSSSSIGKGDFPSISSLSSTPSIRLTRPFATASQV
jgi:aryl-alcohol dehydrogenase